MMEERNHSLSCQGDVKEFIHRSAAKTIVLEPERRAYPKAGTKLANGLQAERSSRSF